MFATKKTHFILQYLVMVLVLLFLLFPAKAFAQDGDGTGNGNGQNRNIPLTLLHASIQDGEKDVPLNPTIQLDFNKNVCNITVLANNKKCFHLTEEGGEAIPIKLIFPDTQLQQDYKDQVFLIPQKDLLPETSYRVSVDNKVTARNGMVIDNAHTFTFTTGTKRTQEENQILKKLGEFNLITYETAYSETADSVPVQTSGLEDSSQSHGPDAGSLAKIAAIVFVLLIAGFTALFLFIRRKKE